MLSRKPLTIFALAIADHFHELPYLPLGMVLAHLKTWNNERLSEDCIIQPLTLVSPDQQTLESVLEKVSAVPRPVCLLSSYVWNNDLNLSAAQKIKQANSRAIVIIGGPEVPKYEGETESFLKHNPCIDVAVLGEGEVTCAEVLYRIQPRWRAGVADLWEVPGIVYRSGEQLLRTEERERVKDVNELPSPYLTGEFEPWFNEVNYTVLETNRGCPYGCTYCDWGSATLQKVTRFSSERVISEVEYIAASCAERVFIADANFGMLEQDIEIARALVEVRERTGYPKRVFTNFAKNGGRRLMEVVKILNRGGLLPTGIIALQTTDMDTLRAIKRDNIKTSAYEKMMEFFNAENIPMSSDLMIGLPGQTVDGFERDLQFCFDWKISANGNYTSMMPNAPMAEKSYRKAYRIEVDDAGLISSTASFTQQDLLYMKSLFMVYLFHVRLGVLKYYLYYLQIEHGIAALMVLRRWLERVAQSDEAMPIGCRVFHSIIAMDKRDGDWAVLSWGEEAAFLFDDLEAYCAEFHGFIAREFDLELEESVKQTLSQAQAAVIPRVGRSYPFTVTLDHDVAAYFDQLNTVPSVHRLEDTFVPLTEFHSSYVRVAPMVIRKSSRFIMLDGHSNDWEYPSNLRVN